MNCFSASVLVGRCRPNLMETDGETCERRSTNNSGPTQREIIVKPKQMLLGNCFNDFFANQMASWSISGSELIAPMPCVHLIDSCMANSMAGRTIMRSAYGIDILTENDPYINIAEESLQAFSATVNAGAYLVDSIPIRTSFSLQRNFVHH